MEPLMNASQWLDFRQGLRCFGRHARPATVECYSSLQSQGPGPLKARYGLAQEMGQVQV